MGRHYFRLSLTREFQALLANAGGFHGMAVEAHILELYSNSVGAFLSSLAKPYYIDPILYRFADPLFTDIREKRWVVPLTEDYGIDSKVSPSSDGLDPSSFSKLKDLKEIVGKILEYQRTRVASLVGNIASFESWIDDTARGPAPPEFLVAPYFLTTSIEALEANVALAKEAANQLVGGEKLFAGIAIPRDYLTSPKLLGAITSAYGALELSGYLLWVLDFKDWQEDSIYLKALARAIDLLRKTGSGREVINSYGGFFSTVLCGRGLLSGSVQGVGISEYKDPFLTGGGFAKRYYVPVAHQLLSSELADDLWGVDSTLFGCPCPECKGGSPPGGLTVSQLANHFLRSRCAELTKATATPGATIAIELGKDEAAVAAIKLAGVAPVTSAISKRLGVWKASITDQVTDGLIS
jgi:hypothetical protein